MELLIDSVDFRAIKEIMEYYPIDGITCNPTILSKSEETPYQILKKIRRLIGDDTPLHVQLLSDDYDSMLIESEKICAELGDKTYIKVPVNEVGLKVIRELTSRGYNVTGTAIYTHMQAVLAAKAGASYVAPYVNRISDLGNDSLRIVLMIQNAIDTYDLNTKVLGASFKNTSQISNLIDIGVGAVTVPTEMFSKFVNIPIVDKAIEDFVHDFESSNGKKSTMLDCK